MWLDSDMSSLSPFLMFDKWCGLKMTDLVSCGFNENVAEQVLISCGNAW